MATFNIGDIFRRAFDYDMPADSIEIPTAQGRKETSKKGGMYYATDALGREFFMPVKIESVLVPFAVVSVTSKKTIVSTPMPERGGSVKELISIDDYAINIKGIVLNPGSDFPEDQIQEMHDLFKENRALLLECVLTDIFLEADQKVVVRECRWPSVAGVEHARPFELELESDQIFDLEVTE